MYCPHCGAPIQANDPFCNACGGKLQELALKIETDVTADPLPADEPSDDVSAPATASPSALASAAPAEPPPQASAPPPPLTPDLSTLTSVNVVSPDACAVPPKAKPRGLAKWIIVTLALLFALCCGCVMLAVLLSLLASSGSLSSPLSDLFKGLAPIFP